jgi:hypothetical protein
MGEQPSPKINRRHLMSEEIKTVKKTITEEEIFIPKGYGNDDPNLYVSINGKNWILPKGKSSTVPKYVADEIRRSWAAQARYDELVDEKLKATH